MELTHFMVASNKSFYENQQIHLLSIASYLDKEIKGKGPKPNLGTYFTWAKIVYLYYTLSRLVCSNYFHRKLISWSLLQRHLRIVIYYVKESQ